MGLCCFLFFIFSLPFPFLSSASPAVYLFQGTKSMAKSARQCNQRMLEEPMASSSTLAPGCPLPTQPIKHPTITPPFHLNKFLFVTFLPLMCFILFTDSLLHLHYSHVLTAQKEGCLFFFLFFVFFFFFFSSYFFSFFILFFLFYNSFLSFFSLCTLF